MLHVDILIGEELRLIKKGDWDSIAMPMLVKRRAGFRNKPDYIERIDLDEETKVICITSNRFKNEWFNTMYNNTFQNYFKNTSMENRVFSIDIFPAIIHGLKSLAWFNQQKQEMDEVSFKAEILNETVGEVDGAYFTLEMFRQNQTIKKAFIPPTTEQFASGKFYKRPKYNNEVRLVFVDFAFSSTVKGSVANDNTVIGCMSIYKKEDKWIRNVEYIETHGGSENDLSVIRIRQIFWDYEADYIVYDHRNGGSINYNDLTKEYIHSERSYDAWDKRGFTIALDREFQMMSDQKLDELKSRTVDQNAVPCLISISATDEFNSDMWMDLNKRLRNSEINFLIDDLEYQQIAENNKNYFKMTSEEKALEKLPYIQTMLLINEAINLSQEWRGGKLKLSEPNTGTKDRVVALGYANIIATKIINKLEREAQSPDYDISDWISVFRM